MSFEKKYLDPVFNAKIYEFLMKKNTDLVFIM